MSATRNIVLLSGNQAITGSSQGIVIAVGALAAATLAPDRALATVPTTVMIIGMALTAGPAAIILHRLGRTRGLMLGVVIAMVGGLVAALSLVLGSFVVLAFGYGLIGAAAAFGQQTRFAAADSVPPDMKARAVSWVMFGGVLAGFLGPRLASMTAEAVPGASYAGSFLSLAALGIVALALLSFTQLPKGERRPEKGTDGRPTAQLLRDPDIFVPMVTAMASYVLMTFVMVAAPLAMVYLCGHTTADAANSIQWHVVAMFAPSFVTGAIINRIGTHLTIGIGLVLILAAAATSLHGITTLHFDIALILLGLGWNFGFIGSTVMLSKGYRPEEGARVQALNEQFVFGTMAIASIGAGVLLNILGWGAINMMVVPIAGAALALLIWADFRGRRVRQAAMPSD
ncbi:MFS transporter [Pelagibacterium xiamenense]|uniref:MFS transporter n=1 Tax=Pelagibacterium xiamenense TaxID=2901140 RepID=UPI001E576C59|nr:MFS transporter [Pelagibacterium xiamenense]MCD7060793.1 MFS transporter [Pelagibacterium xiamenense]